MVVTTHFTTANGCLTTILTSGWNAQGNTHPMTDWETTKIKGDVKERAKKDPRTYTEVMEAGLKYDGQSAAEASKESEFESSGQTLDLGDDLRERLDRLEEAIKEATNAAQSADRKLENMGGR